MNRWVILLYFLLSSFLYATEIDDIQSYIEQKNFVKAYQLADKIKLQFEGDTAFDYYYAIAALETGHADKAVFALERVIANNPENQEARLELARAYYLKGEFSKSKFLFNLMLETSPPENVQNNIKLFLVKIDDFLDTSSFQTSAYAETAIGWDSNISSASDETTIALGNLILNLNSKKNDATYASLKAGGNYIKRDNKFDSYFIGGQMESRDNLSEDLDTSEVSLRGGYLYINNKTRISVPLSYQKINLDGDDYRNLISLSGEWSVFENEKEYSTYIVQYGMTEYVKQSSLDLQFLNFGYSNNFLNNDKDNLISLSLFLGTEFPDLNANKQNTRDYLGFAIQRQNISTSGFNMRFSAYHFNHQAKNKSLNKNRIDDLLSAYVGYKWKISKTWSIESNVGYTNNLSNIDIYSYNRTTAEIRARADF